MLMPLKRHLLVFLFVCSAGPLFAQDTLPAFTVKNRYGRIIISWVNPFDSLVQISIQRSPDTLKGFKTIATLPDPAAVTNGYLDSKAPNANQFYKIYVQQPGGQFFTTKAMRPVVDTARVVASTGKNPAARMSKEDSTKAIRLELAGPPGTGGRYADGRPIADSGKSLSGQVIVTYTPSVFVYTNKDGNVVVALPEAKVNIFSLKFYRENGTPVFQLNRVKEPMLILDKSNFLHSGWFSFELYENDKLLEKKRIYVPRDR